MSAYDTYINELEDLHAYTQGEDFDIGEYLRRLYQLYKNGNFLVIRLIGDFSKRMAEELKDNSFYNFALTIYQAGPTKILDLDFSDQMDFLLHKGEFLADYAKNIDPSYKQMALEALNEYGNMANDGRHMKAKAYLEKPTDENDTLNMEVFKVRLLEYFSYGNELSEEELSLVGIPSSYLSMEKEQLKELLKQYEKNPEELKKVYYVLLYKGEINYVSALAKIDKQFILDYYMKKKDPLYMKKKGHHSCDSEAMDMLDDMVDSKKKCHKVIFGIDLGVIVVDILMRVYPNYSIQALFVNKDQTGLAPLYEGLLGVAFFSSILVPILAFLLARKGKINILIGILFLTLSLETTFCGVIQLESISIQIVFLILTGILFLVSGIQSFQNASKKKKDE